MSGKVWTFTLITTVSFFTIYVHHAQSKCMPQDLQTHFYDKLLEDHFFEMKVFPDLEEQHSKVLSVINTLCSTWNKNKNKDMETFKVIEIFEIMLQHLFAENNPEKDELLQECGKYNCTDGYVTTFINITAFGSMYLQYCNNSGLECPSKKSMTSSISASTSSPASTVSERTASSTPEISQNTTAHDYWSTASSTTTVSQLSTTSSTSTDSPTPNAPTLSPQKGLADTQSKVLLAASLLLNVVLFLVLSVMWYRRNKRSPQQVDTETEVRLIEIRDSNLGGIVFF